MKREVVDLTKEDDDEDNDEDRRTKKPKFDQRQGKAESEEEAEGGADQQGAFLLPQCPAFSLMDVPNRSSCVHYVGLVPSALANAAFSELHRCPPTLPLIHSA